MLATAVITEMTLVEQTRGKEPEYRIVAVDKTGESEQHGDGRAVNQKRQGAKVFLCAFGCFFR